MWKFFCGHGRAHLERLSAWKVTLRSEYVLTYELAIVLTMLQKALVLRSKAMRTVFNDVVRVEIERKLHHVPAT